MNLAFEILPFVLFIVLVLFSLLFINRNFKDTKSISKNFVRVLLMFAVLIAYPMILFFWPSMMVYSGFFLIVVTLLAIKKVKVEIIILILSPIITYPFFGLISLFIFAYLDMRPVLSMYNFVFFIFIYSIIYGYLFRDLWSWIIPNLKTPFVVVLSVFVILLPKIGILPFDCFYVSNAEKGVHKSDIDWCSFFNLYKPTGKFSGLEKLGEVIAIYGPLLVVLVILLTFLFRYLNEKCENS
jgi:hypothetical protein